MEFKTDFPWSFHINKYSDNLFKKSEIERRIIENQYHECCTFSKETVNNLLLTCDHGIIVIDSDGKLRGFCLSETIGKGDNRSFITQLICGEIDTFKMLMDNLRCDVYHKFVNIWDMLIESDNEKVDIILGMELGFEFISEKNGKILMTKKYELIKSVHKNGNEKIKEFFGIK
jgi:hypothetical protein